MKIKYKFACGIAASAGFGCLAQYLRQTYPDEISLASLRLTPTFYSQIEILIGDGLRIGIVCGNDIHCHLTSASSSCRSERRAAIDRICSIHGNEIDKVSEHAIDQLPLSSFVGLLRCVGLDDNGVGQLPEILNSRAVTKNNIAHHVLLQRLKGLLRVVNEKSCDPSALFYTNAAIQGHRGRTPATEEEELMWFDDDSVFNPDLYRTMPHVKPILLCLHALALHSLVENQVFEIGTTCLELLRQVWFQFSGNEMHSYLVRVLILKILSNLSVYSAFSHYFRQNYWLEVLHECSRSNRLELNLLSLKILANLDYDDNVGENYYDGVYVLHPSHRSTKKPQFDIIFIHGLRGGIFRTWRQRDLPNPKVSKKHRSVSDAERLHISEHIGSTERTQCWPKDWLAKEFPESRIVAVDYSSFVTDWASKPVGEREKTSLDNRAKELSVKLIAAGIGDRPIIWVTHSMGGILTKEIIRQADGMDAKNQTICNNTKGIVFYAVPHKGSSLISRTLEKRYGRFVFPSMEVKQLNKDSTYISELQESFLSIALKRKFNCLSFIETEPTYFGFNWSYIMVEPDSAKFDIGDNYSLRMSHLNVCKPDSKENVNYRNLVSFIQNTVK